MTRRAFLGLLGLAAPLAAQTILMLRSPSRYDLYIDDALGNDSNDGLTPATPWQSLNKLEGLTYSAGVTQRVLVKAGTYDKATDYFELANSTGAGAVLDITFEPGCVMDGTASNASAAQNPVFAQGSVAWTLILQGNGLTIQHYNSNTGGSPNGLGNGGTNTILAYDIDIIDCVDGISSHVSSVIKMWNCSASDCTKLVLAPVDSSRIEAYFCTFADVDNTTSAAMGIMTAGCIFEDCIFLPPTDSAASSLTLTGATLTRCRIGTLVDRISLSSTSLATLEDCFVNAYIGGTCDVNMLRCYGKLSTRMNSTSNITAQNCVFVGGASGTGVGATNSVLFRNADLNQGTWEFIDCVLKGYVTCLGSSYGATDAGYFVAQGNFATYINYFGNTLNIDADLVTAAGASVATGVITTDPQIGSADSYDQADYAIGPMSPCIGAGSGGGDIGFQV